LRKEAGATGITKMSEPIRHHYVPVFYLRQWCDATGKIIRYYRPSQTSCCLKIPAVLSSSGTLHLPTFIDNADIGTVMIKMRWFTFDLGSGGISLLTGDRALIRTHGLKDHRCIVALPLSPRFLFVATNAPETDRRLRRAKPEVLARDINARIVAQSKQYVYGATKEHLRFIENRLVR
jgi:hypothetical protein